MAYVYLHSEANLWTVGFYRPDGKFEPESDHERDIDAAKRVAWLNGSTADPPAPILDELLNLAGTLNDVARATGVEPLPVPGPARRLTFNAIKVGIISLCDALRARAARPILTADEPGFLLRAHDRLAPLTIEHWILEAAVAGAPHAKLVGAAAVASAMRQWQREHGSKVPD